MAWLATTKKIGDHRTRWWADETRVTVRCFGCGMHMTFWRSTRRDFGMEGNMLWSQCAELMLELMFHNQPVECDAMKRLLLVRKVMESSPTPASPSAITGFPGGDRTASYKRAARARTATLWSSFPAHILTIQPERRSWSLTGFAPYLQNAAKRGT